jgi:hypothetical protein
MGFLSFGSSREGKRNVQSSYLLQFSYHLSLLPVPHLRQFQAWFVSGGLAKETNDVKIVV